MRTPIWLAICLAVVFPAGTSFPQSYFSHRDLVGKLLVASPGIADGDFAGAVILIVAHTGDGALGLVVNRPLGDAPHGLLPSKRGLRTRVFFGGPVELDREFVLHTSDYATEGTVRVGADFAVSSDPGILEDIAKGKGPRRSLLAVGYAGWDSGQVEEELMRHDWIVVDADETLVFANDIEGLWGHALARQGESL